jgi:hypothetical protein
LTIVKVALAYALVRRNFLVGLDQIVELVELFFMIKCEVENVDHFEVFLE